MDISSNYKKFYNWKDAGEFKLISLGNVKLLNHKI